MVNKGEKLKLDLHTHIWEASSFEKPSIDTAYKVINHCKKIGIDVSEQIIENEVTK